MGLVVMCIFFRLQETVTDTQSRLALIYIVCNMEYYLVMIILLERYCTDLRVFDREVQDSVYPPSAYFAAHVLTSLPQMILQPVVFGVPVYYGCNMRQVRRWGGGGEGGELIIFCVIF